MRTLLIVQKVTYTVHTPNDLSKLDLYKFRLECKEKIKLGITHFVEIDSFGNKKSLKKRD